jgi:hypothetical protein
MLMQPASLNHNSFTALTQWKAEEGAHCTSEVLSRCTIGSNGRADFVFRVRADFVFRVSGPVDSMIPMATFVSPVLLQRQPRLTVFELDLGNRMLKG